MVKQFRANQGVLLAGAVAYYTLLSLVPLLILILMALSHIVPEDHLLTTLSEYLEFVVPGQSGALVEEVRTFLAQKQVVGGILLVTMLFFSVICALQIGPFLVRVFPLDFLGLGGAETMKASKFSDAQKAFILKQGSDGVPVADICRKAGISAATYFNWRKKKYEGLLPTEMRRLKQLEDENGKLKKLVADLSLDREMLQDVIRRKI